MFAEDLSAFFGDLAVDATLGGQSVRGMFDNTYAEFDMGGGVSGSSPVFTLASASVPAPVVGLSLVVAGKTYQVVETMPDGTGITMLRLRS